MSEIITHETRVDLTTEEREGLRILCELQHAEDGRPCTNSRCIGTLISNAIDALNGNGHRKKPAWKIKRTKRKAS